MIEAAMPYSYPEVSREIRATASTKTRAELFSPPVWVIRMLLAQ